MATADEARRELARRELERRRSGGSAPVAGPSVVGDVIQSGGAGLARGAANLAGLPGTIGDALDAGGEWVQRQLGLPTRSEAMRGYGLDPSGPLSGGKLQEAMSGATGGATDYRGQTLPGEYAGTVGEFLPGAAAFGGASLPNLLRMGVAPAVTSETAGQMTKGTALEPYARIFGALLGGYGGAKIGQPKTAKLPTAKEIKQSAGYDALKAPMKEARLTSHAHKQIVKEIWDDAQDFGLTTQLKSQFGGTLRDHLKRAETSGGASLHDLELLRRSLRNAAGDKLDDASQALSARLVNKLDDAVERLSDASIAASGSTGRPVLDVLKGARETYRVGMKADLVETAIKKAQSQASGVENGLRIQFRKIMDNPKLLRNFSETEQRAIRDVAKGNFTSNSLRWLGTFGVPIDQGRNFLGSVMGGGVGATAASALGLPSGVGAIAFPAVGTAAKFGAARETERLAGIVEALVKAGPKGGADFAQSMAQQTTAGREAILRALLQSQSAVQAPSARAGAR